MVKRLLLIVAMLAVSIPAASQDIRGEHLTLLSLVARSSETECLWINSSTGVVVKGTCPVGDITDVSFTLPSAIFTTPPTGSPCTTGNCAFTFALASQSENTIFARSTGSGTPTFQSMTKAMTPATTVHTDQTNTFGAFLQSFGGGLTVSSGTTTTQALSSTTGTFSGSVAANAGITVDTSAFTVADVTGNVSTAGTLAVAGTSDLKGNVSDSTGNLTLNDSVDVLDNLVLGSATGEYAQSANYASRTTGWRIDYDGTADLREGFFDQMKVKLFTVEQTQAVNGSMQWTKSVAELAGESTVGGAVTCPSLGAAETYWFRDFPNAANIRVFQANDYVSIRTLAWSDSGADGAAELAVTDCVGVVTAYADGTSGNDGYQSWTFTRPAGANGGSMTGGTSIALKLPTLNYGVTADGVLEATVNDGTNNVNAPYFGVKKWTTSPIAANFTNLARFGQLRGITSVDEYGIFAGPTFNLTNGQFFRASDTNFDVHGLDFSLWDADSANIIMRRNSGNPYLAIGNAAPTAYATGGGIWMGSDAGTYKFRVGDLSSTDYIAYNGSSFTVRGDLNADDITAGTLTGRTIQTTTNCGSGGGACIKMTNTPDLQWYNSSNQLIGSITGNGILLPAQSGVNVWSSYGVSRTLGNSYVGGLFGYETLLVGSPNVESQTISLRNDGDSGSSNTMMNAVLLQAVSTQNNFSDQSLGGISITTTDATSYSQSVIRLGTLSNVLGGETYFELDDRTDGTSTAHIEASNFTVYSSGNVINATPTSLALGSASNLFVDRSNNRVGINDATPSYALDVNGTIYGQGSVYAVSGFYSNGTAGAAGTESAGYWFGGAGVAHGNIAWQPNEQTFLFRSGNTPTADTDVYGAVDLNTNGDVYAAGFKVAAWATLGNSTNPLCTDVGNGSAGFIYRCAGNWSSRRYKTNIRPADQPWMRVLDIDPVWFEWRPELHMTTETQFGAIAEEVEALGLASLVRYENGKVEGLHYDKIALALIPVVKQQQAQIDALLARLAALERIVTPTAR